MKGVIQLRTWYATPITCTKLSKDVLTVQRSCESWNLDMSKRRFTLDLGNFSIAGPTALEAVALRG